METPVGIERTQGKRSLTSPAEEQERKKLVVSPSVEGRTNDDPATTLVADRGEKKSSAGISTITLQREDLRVIADLLKESFREDLADLVSSLVRPVVDGVVSGLQHQIAEVEEANRALREENAGLKARVERLELKIDEAEQYSRRNCLRVSGMRETEGENTDDLLVDLGTAVGVQLQKHEIDRSHRVGKRSEGGKPRAVIVKFTSYRARNAFYMARTKLRMNGYPRVYVNEDLTKTRSGLLYKARMMVRSGVVNGAWSSDGNVLVKDRRGRIVRITTDADLDLIG